MKKPNLFKEYIWLLNTIRRAGKISFDELNEKWLETDMSEGMPLTKATFGRHLCRVIACRTGCYQR